MGGRYLQRSTHPDTHDGGSQKFKKLIGIVNGKKNPATFSNKRKGWKSTKNLFEEENRAEHKKKVSKNGIKTVIKTPSFY